MIRQKSFDEDGPALYLVPTPIGNLSEMTPRAIETLQSVDVIACEDTRTSGSLLKHFDIHKRLIAYQNFNEETSCKGIIKLLEEGNKIALISDAGYPLINDPGQKVVTLASSLGYPVIPLSGCNAMLNALVASGLVVQPFLFIGFLPQSDGERKKKLKQYDKYPMTMVFYEAPHRITKTLASILEVFGDRNMCLARELTKLHEEFIRGKVSEVLEIADTLKGEMVIVIEGNTESETQSLSDEDIRKLVQEKVDGGESTSSAVKLVAKETGISKNKVYTIVHG